LLVVALRVVGLSAAVGVYGCATSGPTLPKSPPPSEPAVATLLPKALLGPTGPQGLASEGDRASASNGESADDECGEGCESAEIDDGAESSPATESSGRPSRHLLDGWTERQIEAELVAHPERLGSMSLGFTNGGALFNGVQMPRGDGWEVVDPNHAWGTRETVDYLTHCLNEVEQRFPGSAEMYIGHISGRRGGHLSPHVSHQTGRDVDVSYYYLSGQARWYATAGPNNLDRERSWAFVKALVIDTDVEMILMDRSIQRLLREYAISLREDRHWVDELFEGDGSLPPLIRHAKGHATHLHVRFYNPVAQETGRRTYALLLKHRIIQPPLYFVRHKAKQGETLGQLARKYGVTEKAIQQANRLKSSLIRAAREYKIPRRGGVPAAPRMTLVPPRRVPPDRGTG
jgi:penicillin-insensitive murein endopeptidase